MAYKGRNFNNIIRLFMKDNLCNSKEYLVYPGEYVPMPEVEALLEELMLAGNDSIATPPVNMDEFRDCYKLEVAVPGVSREDFFITVHNTTLSITVLHKEDKKVKKGLQIHEFETTCFERHLLLPENADTEFVSAEYNRGILSLHIPKTYEPPKARTSQIVVY
jgi:HSP20 family protein